MTERICIEVYRATVLSLFDYSSFSHDGANKDLIVKLDRLQKRGLKICYKGKVMTEETMYRLSDIPKLARRRQELLLSYMFKLSRQPKWVDDRARRPGLRSENQVKFKLPRARSHGLHNSPLFRGAALWNNLGSWYQTSKDKFTCKRRIHNLTDLTKVNWNPTDAVFDDL